jgi:hypothetical protein
MPCQQVSKLVNEREILSAVGLSGEIDENQGRENVVEAKTTELISRQRPMSIVSDDTAHHHKDTHIFERFDDVTSPLVRAGRIHPIKKQKLAHTVSNHVRIILRAHGTEEWKFLSPLFASIIVVPVLELLVAVNRIEKIPGRTFDNLAVAGTHVCNGKCLIRRLGHDERTQGHMRKGCEFLKLTEAWQGVPAQPIPEFRKLFDRFFV